MRTRFGNFILNSPNLVPMPIGIYAGLEITGASVRQSVMDAHAQSEAVQALHERFNTPVMLTAMDLSVEAEEFGCEIRMTEDEIPTVIGRKVTSLAEIDRLPDPVIGSARSVVSLETARMLLSSVKGIPVLGGVIGPFSLAGRIFGVSESLEVSLTEPEVLKALLEKVTRYLIRYLTAFREAGVHGVIMAEPAAGLLSPRGLSQFSSVYVKRIIESTVTPEFTVVLHNCGAKLVHLPKVLEAGAEIFHFGALMDIGQALTQVGEDIILSGNLDPTGVFHNGNPQEVTARTRELLQAAAGHSNFIPSSGCDIPPHSPLGNLAAFYDTIRG